MQSVPGGGTPLRLIDQQRLEVFIRRAVRAGLYPADGPNLHQLVSDEDDTRILANEHHVLRQLLPNTTTHSHSYGLRSRRHNYTLNIKSETRCRIL